MVRGVYDYNQNFNPTPGGPNGTLQFMFDFTGNRPVRPQPNGTTTGPIGIGGSLRLGENWIIDWDRFTSVGPGIQRARKIDSHVARLLLELPNEDEGQVAGLLKNLARRNLRRGMVHNLAPAQAIFDVLDLRGIACSAGSACQSGSVSASHVLAAMGVSPQLANAALRLSLGCLIYEVWISGGALRILLNAVETGKK